MPPTTPTVASPVFGFANNIVYLVDGGDAPIERFPQRGTDAVPVSAAGASCGPLQGRTRENLSRRRRRNEDSLHRCRRRGEPATANSRRPRPRPAQRRHPGLRQPSSSSTKSSASYFEQEPLGDAAEEWSASRSTRPAPLRSCPESYNATSPRRERRSRDSGGLPQVSSRIAREQRSP